MLFRSASPAATSNIAQTTGTRRPPMRSVSQPEETIPSAPHAGTITTWSTPPPSPASVARGSDKFVKSTMKTSSETIAFNYRTHQVGSDWKITDVYLAGNISQMAQKRSDFAATLAASGPSGLAKRINALTDQMLG